MKKNLLALSIAAMVGGLSGVANAQAVVTDTTGALGRNISNTGANTPALAGLVAAGVIKAAPGAVGIPAAATTLTPASTGVGHVLFVPYFTTQGSHATLLNLVNHDRANAKAVKLRFRGAANSDDLFDITVFLSPGDVWSANVSANGELSALTTSDTSCTLPSAEQIRETAGKFSTNRVAGAADQTREGYVEILNMADIPVNAAPNSLYTAVKHASVSDVWKAPCNSAVMDLQAKALSLDPADSANWPATRGYSWPTGGLSANWTIVDVGTKASFSGEAVALRATPTDLIDQAGSANLVFSPQTGEAVTNAGALTADPLLKTGAVRPASYDFPDLSTPYTTVNTPEQQANDLASVLATYSVANEYLTNAAVNFATDWVFSMPTRRYAVALNYETKAIVGHGVPTYAPAATAGFVFSKYFNADATSGNASLNREKNRICVDAGTLASYDREENSKTSFVISPGDTLKFCGETSVLTFNGKGSLLGAKIAVQDIPTGFSDGWLNIATPGYRTNGLPVVGFAVSKAIGADGGNFGGTWMHRTNRFANQGF